MSVACGNRKAHPNLPFPMQPHHETVAQVKLCFARDGGVDAIEEQDEVEEYVEEYDADAAYERHLEDQGWQEADLDARMEAERGVIQFEDALRDADEAASVREAKNTSITMVQDRPRRGGQCDDTCTVDCGHCKGVHTKPITPAEVFAAKPILDGIYTVERPGAAHRTFRLRTQPSDDKFMPGKQIIGYLNGPDNEKDYAGFGNFEGARLRIWAKHRGNTALVDDANFLLTDIEGALKAVHCYRCHALLTVPESVLIGFGPDCAKMGV